LQIFTYLIGYALIITSSVCLLLMHKARAEETTRRLATIDPLTGACNRRTFMLLAEKTLAHARRGRLPTALLMLDIDHFKQVNDRYGHLVGDEALQHFVATIRSCLREGDVLMRYGGEEFCVLLPAATADGAHLLAERIRQTISLIPFAARDVPIRLTASIGIAATEQGNQQTIEALLDAADHALYLAKQSGRDRVAFAPLGPWHATHGASTR